MAPTITYYSQNFEDVYLWRCFRGVARGFYIDVGACDPEFESVTKVFYDAGWSGVNIDPSKRAITKFNHERSRDINIEAFAWSEDDLIITFYESSDAGRSTGVPAYQALLADDALHCRSVHVRSVTLDTVLSPLGELVIHFLKIDAEGAELEILKGINLSQWRAKIIVVESVDPRGSQAPNDHAIEELLLGSRYQKVMFDGVNSYWCAEEASDLAVHFQLPPSCLDGIRPYQVVEARKQASDVMARRQSTSVPLTLPMGEQAPIFLLVSHASPGLAQDRKVIADLLSSLGCEVHQFELPAIYYLQGIPIPLPETWKGRVVALMFEHVFAFSVRPVACLYYVNPEWIVEQDLARIQNGSVDIFLTKTLDAQARISAAFPGVESVFTGFASQKLHCSGIKMSYDKAVHVRGFAQQKGTATILKAYERGLQGLPECVCTMRTFDPAVPKFVSRIGANCRIVFKDIDQSGMDRIVARRGLHLCPSEREGFGHYIFGPMSIGAVVLVPDSPPMNELVDASCGLLVPAIVEDRGLYSNATVSVDDLAEALRHFMAMELERKLDMGQRARLKAEAMREEFESRFGIFISLLLASLPRES